MRSVEFYYAVGAGILIFICIGLLFVDFWFATRRERIALEDMHNHWYYTPTNAR